MPAANQFPLPALRISSTGVAQEDGGGGGDSTSSILKFPFAARGTGFVLRSTNGATFSQMSVAKTLRLAAGPPVGVSTSAVPMASPEENTRPRPSTAMRPSSFTSAFNLAMTHEEAGCTPRTMLRVTTVATGAIPWAFETGSTPIPPSNLTSVSSASENDSTSPSKPTASIMPILMTYLLVIVRFSGSYFSFAALPGCSGGTAKRRHIQDAAVNTVGMLRLSVTHSCLRWHSADISHSRARDHPRPRDGVLQRTHQCSQQ